MALECAFQKKVEKSKSVPKERVANTQKEVITPKEEIVTKKVETRKPSVKDLVDTPSSSATTSSSNESFIRIFYSNWCIY